MVKNVMVVHDVELEVVGQYYQRDFVLFIITITEAMGNSGCNFVLRNDIKNTSCLCGNFRSHTMDMLWEKFQWIPPLYMKPISFQSKASVVCSVTTAIVIDFCPKKLNVS